nr:hypothetical protein [Tanacetum cinerariifolium]
TSSKNLSKLLDSQVYDKTGIVYDSQVFDRQVFDFKELHSDESVNSVPASLVIDSGKGYRVVSPPYTGTFMPPKPDLVINDAPTASESIANVVPIESNTNKPSKDMSLRPDAPIIEDWTSDSEDESEIESFNHLIKDCDYYEKQMVQNPVCTNAMRVNHQHSVTMTHPHSSRNVVPTTVLTRSRLVSLNAARPVSTAVPQTTVKSPRPVKHAVNKAHLPIRRPINHRPATKTSNFNKHVTTVKVNKVNVVQGVKGNVDKASTNWGNPQQALKDKGVIDNGCSRHITGNISFLSDFEEINGGYVAFGGNPKGGKVTGKDTKCVVLSSDYKPPDENHVLLRVPRENNMYNVDLKNVVPSGDLTLDESTLWHRRLSHINFKTMNKLVKGNLVRGLPSNIFENNHTCVACKKGKQHRASYKSNLSVLSANYYKAAKDETSAILKTFITSIENQINHKVKIIRSDNRTEFKNHDLNQFCGMKGIKREFSIVGTPQQNGVAERKNKTLIEAAKTMLADSLLPIPF